MEQEFSGKNVESAIKKGLKKLNVSKEEVKIKVLDEGKAGLFGLMGASPAKVKIILSKSKREINVDLIAKSAYDFTSLIIHQIDKDAVITVNKEGSKVNLDIKSSDGALIIGRHGETLRALQYIVNLMLKRNEKTRVNISIDVEGYKVRRRKQVIDKLKEAVERVKKYGEEIILDPMDYDERRAIYKEAENIEGIKTKSDGTGDLKKIIVTPLCPE